MLGSKKGQLQNLSVPEYNVYENGKLTLAALFVSKNENVCVSICKENIWDEASIVSQQRKLLMMPASHVGSGGCALAALPSVQLPAYGSGKHGV